MTVFNNILTSSSLSVKNTVQPRSLVGEVANGLTNQIIGAPYARRK
jgi:hypothetical protein